MRISDWSSDVCSSDLRETEKRAASASSSSTSPGASSPARISFSIAARTELECVSFAKKIDQSIRKLLPLNRAKSFHGQVNAVPLHAPTCDPNTRRRRQCVAGADRSVIITAQTVPHRRAARIDGRTRQSFLVGGIEAQHSRTIACHATVGTDKSIRPRLPQIGNGATNGMPGGDQNIVIILGQCESDRSGSNEITSADV